MTVEVPLHHGYIVLVDDADLQTIASYRWFVSIQPHTCYAVREIRKADGRRSSQRMHTLLTGYPRADHINGNGLDNRRANLRPATAHQNQHNRRKVGVRSRYKGICRSPSGRQWQARLRQGDRSTSLGYFTSAEEAARAYDAAARAAYGEFACVNFPVPGERGALDREP